MSSMAAILLYTVVPGALYESLGNVFLVVFGDN